MQLDMEVQINRPLDEVVALFENKDLFSNWQEGFVSISDIPRSSAETGASSVVNYEYNGRNIEVTVSIEKNDLPHEFVGIYEIEGMWNRVANYFHEDENGATTWKVSCQYESSTFLLKLLMFFWPKFFTRVTSQYMARFKEFAENHHEAQISRA